MRYQKLTTMSDDLLLLSRKLGVGVKKNDVDAAVKMHLSSKAESGMMFGAMMEDYVLAEEDYWRNRTKRRVIYPTTDAFLRQLMSDDFELTDAEGFDLPFDSFVLAMPKGFAIDGVEIPTCLVTWIGAKEHVATVLNGFLARHNRPSSSIRLMPENMNQRSLSIIVPARDGSFSRVMCYHRLIPQLLRTKDIAEYRELVGNLSDQTIAQDLDEYDSKQQYLLLKLVAAVGVYIAACGDQGGLTEGFHNAAQRASVLPKTIKTVRGYALREVDETAPERDEEAKSVFVQMEAEDAPEKAASRKKKSRWVFVRNPITSPTDYD